MDPLEQVIREIHTELERRTATKVVLAIGTLDKNKHKRPPAVLWVEEGGSEEQPNCTMQDTLCFDVSRVHVTVWGESAEYCRLLYWNLKQAAHKAWGHDLQWVDRSPPNDAQQTGWATCGIVIEATAKLYLRVPAHPMRLPHGNEPPADTLKRQVINTEITGATISTDSIDEG
jgi:hypothetical protein